MTTNTRDNDSSRLYRMLEGMGHDIQDLGATVRGMSETVNDLLSRTESIYDAVARDHRYGSLNGDAFLDEPEE